MPIEFQDVLKINIVLVGMHLLNEQHQRSAFATAVGEEVEPEPIFSGPIFPLPLPGVEAGLAMQLRKDRIRIDSLPSRTVIEQEYPTHDSLERLTEVAAHAIGLTDLGDQTMTAFGLNIEQVYRHPGEKPTEMYLAEKLFPHQQLFFKELVLTAGAGRFTYEGDDNKWNFVVEPRANDATNRKVFMSLNLHRDQQQVPNREEILDLFQQVWNRSRELATRLDGGA
ncbi:MAG: hypothetical protein OXL97_08880 [Chloroflexota bacterium]|nr:hypothetical protein [Chloroflexota bacterium]MDE2885455.1 hypothetical protein [Chloroflexota bacterium]